MVESDYLFYLEELGRINRYTINNDGDTTSTSVMSSNCEIVQKELNFHVNKFNKKL